MNQAAIFEPVFVLLILTFLVWVYLFARRIPFIQKSNFGPGELTPSALQQRSPPEVSNPSDNLKNLFEIPVVFYVVCFYLFVTQQVDQLYLVAAWCYAALRVIHSLIHCTFNAVMLRFLIYAVSCLVVWAMVLRIIFISIS